MLHREVGAVMNKSPLLVPSTRSPELESATEFIEDLADLEQHLGSVVGLLIKFVVTPVAMTNTDPSVPQPPRYSCSRSSRSGSREMFRSLPWWRGSSLPSNP
jgi:hypothetical protein